MATAVLLEKYVVHYEAVPGETFQVPIGASNICDFKIGKVFLEYHPHTLHHDFDDRDALRQLWSALSELESQHTTEKILSAIRAELARKYYEGKSLLISLSVNDEHELIVVQNPEELYALVISRFCENPPSLECFVTEFNQICRQSIIFGQC